MKHRLTIIYLLGIHILLAIVLFNSDFIDKVQYKIGIHHAASHPEITQHFHRMLRYHKRMDGNIPDGAILFIGDSITQGLYVSGISSQSVNYGIGSDTTVGVLQRLPLYDSAQRASAVVIAIGINDLGLRSNDEIVKNYRAIIDLLPADIPVIFSAVLPLDQEAKEEWQGRNEGRIRSLNTSTIQLASTRDNVFFVDAGPLLVDESGNLADIYHDGDGVHLNSAGNAIWIDILKNGIKTAQSGSRGYLSPNPHTSRHAGPHRAVQ